MVEVPATVVHRRSSLPNLDGWLWDNDEGFMSVGYDFENTDKIFLEEPLYVLRIDSAGNIITVDPKSGLFSDTLFANDLNFISAERPG